MAALFRVNPKTVTRWARSGKLTAIRTLGGHRRFRASEIRRCLDEMSREACVAPSLAFPGPFARSGVPCTVVPPSWAGAPT